MKQHEHTRDDGAHPTQGLSQERSNADTCALVPVDRRKFLVGGIAGATALALSPLEKVLAAHTSSYLTMPDPDVKNQGLWLLYQFGREFAKSLGFGWAVDTALVLLDQFVLKGKISKWQKESAEKGIGAAWDMIVGNRNLYGTRDFLSLTSRLIDGNNLLHTAFTKLLPAQSAAARFRPANFNPQISSDDLRYFAASYSRDAKNILVPFFNYEGGDERAAKYDPRAILGYPSLDAYKWLTAKKLKQFKEEKVKEMTYPVRQLETSYGVIESSFKTPDRYETAAKTTVEMFYEHKGPYRGNDAKPGQQYGYVHVNLHGFECPVSMKRQGECKDDYLLIYPK